MFSLITTILSLVFTILRIVRLLINKNKKDQ